MSIQEFHSQLAQTDQPDALMATLCRLARRAELAEGGEQVIAQLDQAAMGIWSDGLATR